MNHRVLSGARLLDRINPDWEFRINLETLDIGSCTACIIGQLFKTDAVNYARYYLKSPNENVFEFLDSRGFYRQEDGAAWRELIRERRAKVAPIQQEIFA